jgi:hypothetical protein
MDLPAKPTEGERCNLPVLLYEQESRATRAAA